MNQFFVDFLVASYGRTNLGKPVSQGVEKAEIEKLDLEQDARSEHQIVKEAFEEQWFQHAEKDVVYVLTIVNVNEEVYIEEVEGQLYGNRSNSGVNKLDVVPKVQDNICKTFNTMQKLANHPNNKVGGDFMKSSSLLAPGSVEFPKELLSNGLVVLAICSDFYSGYHQFEVLENTPVKDETTFQGEGMQLRTKGFKCKMAQENSHGLGLIHPQSAASSGIRVGGPKFKSPWEGWSLAELFRVRCIVAAPYVVPYSAPSTYERQFKREHPLLYKYLEEAPMYMDPVTDLPEWHNRPSSPLLL
ncbi:hypothetical protein TIFTF001_027974 [Ficus carica]|uniref:Uncharacterized protein n=1 Tax=Ficus carica TaxID=3494 RepID=A0AA88DP17_FICCA|nr:hypothetical protein TIFTF001_027974 [Ficus carica]